MIIDYLRILVEAVSRAVPALLAQRRNKERRALGVQLYLTYIAINEALIRGELIVQCVEKVVADDGADPYETRDAAQRLQATIEEQIRCFQRIADLLAKWREVLQLLDGQSFASLYLLLNEKIEWLRHLRAIARSGEFPVLDDAELDRLERALEAGAMAEDDVWIALDQLRGLPIPSVPDAESRATRKELETYLAQRKPREQLLLIRQHLEQMRSALLEQITVEDLLLNVGDQGFSPRRELDR